MQKAKVGNRVLGCSQAEQYKNYKDNYVLIPLTQSLMQQLMLRLSEGKGIFFSCQMIVTSFATWNFLKERYQRE